ncbi:hypothetical protein MY5147_005392 [Beauveria neobassiana]
MTNGNTVDAVPDCHGHALAAPNLFVEAKAPRGSPDEDEPAYDGNAHAYCSTYHNGQLMLYAHHVIGPTAKGERPEYHITQLKAYSLRVLEA